MSGMGPAGCWATHKRLEGWAKAAKERALGHHHTSKNGSPKNNGKSAEQEAPVPKDSPQKSPPAVVAETTATSRQCCSSSSHSPSHLQHQSKSYPGGPPPLCRTPSVSSQGSLDSGGQPKHVGGSNIAIVGHRGSSPQIRAFGPDGGKVHQEAAHTSSYPLRTTSRSPSPLRAASLDIRSSSPAAIAMNSEDLRTPSPSQSSLTSLTGGSPGTCNSPVPASPRTISLGRCLSPLFIPRSHTPEVNTTPSSSAPPASPLGAIQPDLYLRRDAGPLFIGSSPKSGPSLGRLHYRLAYDFDRSDLVVHLIEAHNLTQSEEGGFNDPYVRLALSPEVDARKRQTTIHHNDPNPFFDQHFKFPISHEDLQAKTLVLQVFDYDRFSRNDVIGEVRMRMDELDVTSSIEVWGDITKNKKPPEELQEILISLSYLPSAERLTVVILRARNLFLPQEKDSIDPYVKVYLVINGKRTKKKKTTARKANCNPVWDEPFTFSLSSTHVQNAGVEVCIMDQANDLMGTNPLLGCCLIGQSESGPERDHWLEMTQSPRKAVASWHTIR